MKTIIQLVDSIDYVQSNCFQHQLAAALNESCNLIQIELSAILEGRKIPHVDGVISCLKQRTLDRHRHAIAKYLEGRSLVVYDQDPWQSFMDDSPHKGSYDRISASLNVKTFALTTKWWVDFLKERNMPSMFVRMWVLPQYVIKRPTYLERTIEAGFVGTVHPRRKQLLDIINAAGIKTSVPRSNSFAYGPFLAELGKIRCFIHNEDMPILIDGKEYNFNTGMWIKDIEAISQGCFSIRDRGEDSETYLRGLNSLRLFDNIKQAPDVIRAIEKMDPGERQAILDIDVKFIREANVWAETAATLLLNV